MATGYLLGALTFAVFVSLTLHSEANPVTPKKISKYDMTVEEANEYMEMLRNVTEELSEALDQLTAIYDALYNWTQTEEGQNDPDRKDTLRVLKEVKDVLDLLAAAVEVIEEEIEAVEEDINGGGGGEETDSNDDGGQGGGGGDNSMKQIVKSYLGQMFRRRRK